MTKPKLEPSFEHDAAADDDAESIRRWLTAERHEAMARYITLAVEGLRNVQRLTKAGHPENAATLEMFAGMVRGRDPFRNYVVLETSGASGAPRRNAAPLYTWHVPENVDHREGWWVDG